MIESFSKKELEEKIDRYVNGQLSAQEVDDLWSELIQDGYSLDYLKNVANLKAVIEREKKDKKARHRNYRYYLAAAVVVLLLAVIGVISYSIPVGPASIQPVASVELDYYRSEDGVLTTKDPEVIRNAIRLANTGKVNEAISLLNSELADASEPAWIAKLSLNLGSLHYNQGNFERALSYYNKVIKHEGAVEVLTLEKAYWYAGNSYFHLDNLSEARSYIKKAYELNGAYRRVAGSYLNALSSK